MKTRALLIAFLLGAMLLVTGCQSTQYDALADCITASGAKMYGAFWCPHCKEQKEEFGASWSKINYIECSLPDGRSQTEFCTNAGIESYPTWEFADGTRESGRVPIPELAARTGCSTA